MCTTRVRNHSKHVLRRQNASKQRFVPYDRKKFSCNYTHPKCKSNDYEEFLYRFSLEYFGGEALVPLDETDEQSISDSFETLNSETHNDYNEDHCKDSVDGEVSEQLGRNVKHILKGVLSTILFYPRDHPEKLAKMLDKLTLRVGDKNLTKERVLSMIQEKTGREKNISFLTNLFEHLHRILKQNFKGKNYATYLNLFLKLCKLIAMFIRGLQ